MDSYSTPAPSFRRAPLPVTILTLAAVLLWMTATTVAAAEEDDGPPEIVLRAIEHHGGDRYRGSETSLELCSGSGCYPLTVRIEDGLYRHRVSGPYHGRSRTVTADNESVTATEDGEPLAVTADNAQRLRDWATARLYFAFLPYRLTDPGVLHQDQGVEKWRGRELHRVKVSFVSGSSSDADDEYLYWFDPETGRLEQFAYSYSGSPGGLRFRRLSNYRRVGGILFFDQLNLGVEGAGLAVDQITPAFVAERLREVSRVTLNEIAVTPLADD